MEQTGRTDQTIRFGTFDVNARSGELRKSGTRIRLQDQPFKVLLALLERPGEVVTREELRRRIWPQESFGDFDHAVSVAVGKLRTALGDCAETPRYVETLHRRGYRFVFPLTPSSPHADAPVNRASDNGERLPPESGEVKEAIAQFPIPSVTRRWNRAIIVPILFVSGTIGYVVHRWMSPDTRPSIENIQITKLTDSGKAGDVAISPDGRYVAYCFSNGDESSLRLRQVSGRGETQVLTHDALLVPGLAFSPDGNHLYFLRETPKDTNYKDLYEIPSLGGLERKVTSNVDSAVGFSPDGRQFVYERGMNLKDSVAIRIANTDGGADRLLVSIEGAWAGYTPGTAWSPDGRSIAVSMYMNRKKPPNVLAVISAANGALRELYSGIQVLGRPRWLPDGNMLVMLMTDQSGHRQLWTVSYPEGRSRRLTNDLAEYDSNIDATRDGRMLATIQRNAVSNLWRSSLRDGSDKQLTFGEQLITEVFPLDEKQLAIVNRAENGVWVMDPDGTHPRLVGDATRAFWYSGCGRFILFVTDRNGTPELMRVDSDGANVRRLVTGNVWGESCSPDGKFVYYAEALKPRWKIRRVPIEGGRQ
jgi:DNA-binding winged helix-turn-helix (wHTH) protein/Tol biopolymer transport system component